MKVRPCTSEPYRPKPVSEPSPSSLPAIVVVFAAWSPPCTVLSARTRRYPINTACVRHQARRRTRPCGLCWDRIGTCLVAQQHSRQAGAPPRRMCLPALAIARMCAHSLGGGGAWWRRTRAAWTQQRRSQGAHRRPHSSFGSLTQLLLQELFARSRPSHHACVEHAELATTGTTSLEHWVLCRARMRRVALAVGAGTMGRWTRSLHSTAPGLSPVWEGLGCQSRGSRGAGGVAMDGVPSRGMSTRCACREDPTLRRLYATGTTC